MAEHLAGFFVTDAGYGAGVDDVNVGFALRVHYFKSRFLKSLLHYLCFILVNLAAKGEKCSFHISSH